MREWNIIGTIQFVDLGAGEFYLVTDADTKYRIVFDYKTEGVYDALRTLSETDELYCLTGHLTIPDAEAQDVSAGPSSTEYTITFKGVQKC